MNFYSLSIIAIALSLDAFGVALSIGLDNRLRMRNKLIFSLSFGFFQFLFALIGSYTGFLFNKYIVTVPNIVGGIIIALVGAYMIVEGASDKDKCPFLDPKMYIILGISVSIDAVVIGFTVLNKISSSLIIFSDTIYIGIVTFIFSAIGFFIARYLKRIQLIEKYADYLGGIILIAFGLKMIFF